MPVLNPEAAVTPWRRLRSLHRGPGAVARVFLLLPALTLSLPAQSADPALNKVREFADTLLAHGLDRYGPKATPAWVSILDLKTRRIPETKDPNWQRAYDAEDYMRNARGSNLYRDIGAIQAFYELSARTGDARYRQAADEYLDWFMRNCASPTTGLFAWGEHMFYNAVREEIEANRHELERQLPPWEEMWRLNPQAVRREIEAIYRYHIHDKETFNYDRHGNYFTGQFDDPQVRGPYTKHSGLYAYSFLFLYTRTGEAQHLEWARKAGLMFYKVRHPHTNLVGGAWAPQQSGSAFVTAHLAWYLLKAYRLDRRETELRDAAAVMLKSYLRAAWDPAAARFHRDVNVADASPLPGYVSPWGDGQGETGIFGQAALMAFQETRDADFLEFARRYASAMLTEPGVEGVRPETCARNIDFLLDLYEETREAAYLRAVRRVVDLVSQTLFENGLIKESPDGYIYNANSGAGELARAFLHASRIEQSAPVPASVEDRFPVFSAFEHPRLSRTGQATPVSVRVGSLPAGAEVSLVAPAGLTLKPASARAGLYRFALPPASSGGPRPFALRVSVPGRVPWQGWSPQRSVEVSQTAAFPHILLDGQPAPGVETMSAGAADFPPPAGALPWLFRLPAGAAGRLAVRLSEKDADPFLPHSPRLVRLSGKAWVDSGSRYDAGARMLEAPASPGLHAVVGEPSLQWRLPTDGALLTSPLIADFRGDGKELQIALATNDIDRTLHMLRADGSQLWRFPARGPLSTPVLVPSAGRPAIAFSSLDTLYLVDASGRELWSRRLPGRLGAPAFAAGRIYVASSTGQLLVFDSGGAELWRHTLPAAAVSTPVIADLKGDGTSVILLGAADSKLHAIADGGGELWSAQARGPRFLAPTAGDIDGDGKPEVVFAAKSVSTVHEVVALNSAGTRLWSFEAHREGEWAPVLADMEGLGYNQVIVQTELQRWPRCELTILGRDGRRLRGLTIHSRVTMIPVATDLDGDGRPDLVFPSNEDRRMHGLANDGRSLWSFAPLSLNFAGAKMKGGGTPAIADVDGDGRLEVIAGDDETVLNCIRTETRVPPRTIVSGQFRHSGAHTGVATPAIPAAPSGGRPARTSAPPE